jgi:seryl-tRNA synthetase
VIDIKIVRHEPDLLRDALSKRGMDVSIVDRLRDMDEKRRQIVTQSDDLKGQRNAVSKELGQKKKAGEDITAESARMRAVGEQIDGLDKEKEALEAEQLNLLECVPNLPHADVPLGKDDSANVEIRQWGTRKTKEEQPLNHWEVGENLDIVDFKRAAKISGSRFWLLKGQGARLERALMSYFLDLHTLQNGYTEILPPSLVCRQSLYGTGQLPRFEEDLFKCQDTDLFLIPTSEVPITNMHAQEILDVNQLPLHYCGFSSCFRSEAGAAGRDSRGLIRVHEFHKVELVKICAPENSYAELDSMVADAEKVLQGLGIAYRVVKVCIGDLGFTPALKYDIEFWSPSQDRWVEISSCSNCTDFQARRAQIRFRRTQKSSPEYCHTLNGSGLAIGRTMVAILENYQNSDGSVTIPEVLRQYMGGQTKIAPQVEVAAAK